MARRPLKNRKPNRMANANAVSNPSPTLGWVTTKNVAEMLPGEALVLDNAFPTEEDVAIRKGIEQHATGLTGSIETLVTYGGLAGNTLLSASNGEIHDVTASGAVGAALGTGFSNNRWQYINFGTAGGQFAIMVNGADTPQKFDGTTLSTTAITGTGLTPTDLVSVNEFKERVFFLEEDSLAFWFLPIQQIAGVASKFDLASLCSKGGKLMAMGTWTRDGGSGMDDVAAFITSEGQVLVYQGTNPANANFWALAGVYNIAPPVGRRCFVNIGSELFIITRGGVIPLSVVIAEGFVNASARAISANIAPTFLSSAKSWGANFGWEGTQYADGNMNIFNVPVIEGSTQYQYVSNAKTGAWCRFTGWDANTFGVLDNELYFGGNSGIVYKADTGKIDDATNISVDIQGAFSYLGNKVQEKKATQIRPVISTDGALTLGISVISDFASSVAPVTSTTSTSSVGAEWDVATWDVDMWSPEENVIQNWHGVEAIGRAFSYRLAFETGTTDFRLKSMDWQWLTGGVD